MTPRKTAEAKALLSTKSYSNRGIARKLSISESSVRRIKKKIQLGEELIPQRKKKCGRKPAFTPRAKRCLKKICLEDRFATTKEIKSRLASSGISVCERTVRRQLSDMDFNACRPARKPKLTKAAQEKRLKWAKDLKDKELEFWRSVSSFLFSTLFICFKLSRNGEMYTNHEFSFYLSGVLQ